MRATQGGSRDPAPRGMDEGAPHAHALHGDRRGSRGQGLERRGGEDSTTLLNVGEDWT